MKLKKEYAVLVVVISVLVLYLWLHKKDRAHYQLPVVPEISNDRITQIEIDKSDGSIILNRKDKSWYIGPDEYLADSEKVKSMLDVIEKLTVTALVSESKNYFRYDLNNNKKITIKAWEGATLKRKFDVGKSAATFRHTFIKLEEDPNVYHARDDVRQTFDQTIDKLRDKNVMSFEPNDIREIQISTDKKTILISRKDLQVADDKQKDAENKPVETKKGDVVWQTAEGDQLKASDLKQLLSSLSRLGCEKYIKGAKKDDFKVPELYIKLNGEAKEYSISVFSKTDKDATNYPAISSENKYPFLLSGSQVDNLKTNMDKIIKTDDRLS